MGGDTVLGVEGDHVGECGVDNIIVVVNIAIV